MKAGEAKERLEVAVTGTMAAQNALHREGKDQRG